MDFFWVDCQCPDFFFCFVVTFHRLQDSHLGSAFILDPFKIAATILRCKIHGRSRCADQEEKKLIDQIRFMNGVWKKIECADFGVKP